MLEPDTERIDSRGQTLATIRHQAGVQTSYLELADACCLQAAGAI